MTLRPGDDPAARWRRPQPVAATRGARTQYVTLSRGEVMARDKRRSRVVVAASSTTTFQAFVDSTVVTAAPRGRVSPMAADEVSVAPLYELGVLRRPPSYPGMTNIISLFPVRHDDEWTHQWSESRNETHAYVDLTLDKSVRTFVTQALLFEWRCGSLQFAHFPDAVIDHWDGSRTLLDVRRADTLSDAYVQTVLAVTEATAHRLGWAYEVRTEVPRQFRVNQRHLWDTLRVTPGDRALVREVVTQLTMPCTFVDLVHALGGDTPRNRWLAEHALATQLLFCDLHAGLRDDMWLSGTEVNVRSWVRRTLPGSPDDREPETSRHAAGGSA